MAMLFEREPRELGREPEICVAGPEANKRTAGHLRNFLPGLTFAPYSMGPAVTIRVGDRQFPFVKGTKEHVASRLRPCCCRRTVSLHR